MKYQLRKPRYDDRPVLKKPVVKKPDQDSVFARTSFQPPERLRHVFDFYGIGAKSTPERALEMREIGIRSEAGYVYIISNGQGMYKIGVTVNVRERLSQIQNGSGYDLVVVKKWRSESAYDVEYVLHSRLHRYRRRGEWFALPKRIADRLCAMPKPPSRVCVVTI